MSGPFPLVVLGCSWGGLDALGEVLDGLPDDLPAAVVIVQHRMHRPSELAALLAQHTPWEVCEAEDKERIAPGRVFLAPPGYHLLVDGDRFALSTEAPVRNSRPSVDVLFESVARSFGPAAIAVVLTGANDDGAAGLVEIVRSGGSAIVQDPATAVRSDMPAAALASGVEAIVADLVGVAEAVVDQVRIRTAGAS